MGIEISSFSNHNHIYNNNFIRNSGSINAGMSRSDWHFAVDSGLVEVNQSFITAHLQSYYSCNLDSLQIIN